MNYLRWRSSESKMIIIYDEDHQNLKMMNCLLWRSSKSKNDENYQRWCERDEKHQIYNNIKFIMNNIKIIYDKDHQNLE